ncbi:ABC transporter substrate-binding protein [Cellulomonas sp. HD19AZ1]|uniref:ABC transporter substrate-binding protein n=1 Tax=Cellulomonas sp. HD19AZ1 TaxID=2559593 RepID=UPI001070BA26|nr:ABC transporter substrate-binding protein [Cellulomonas sp. HD19AZ1]TFH71848.1 ABC transporter substrate-binding protein [Cellulomonas sp. HD19AZ1]
MKKRIAALAVAVALLASACTTGSPSASGGNAEPGSLPTLEQKDTYTIGFSAQQSDHPWTIALNESIKSEAEKRGHKVVTTDAQGSTAKQVSDVESLIAQRVDVIVISPREEKPLAEATIKARDAGIPVFIVDRKVDASVAEPGKDYVAYIGSDFVAEGRAAGEWLVERLDGTGKIIELTGTTGSSAADDRHKGFMEALEGSSIEIVASQDGDFVRDNGRQLMETLIQQYPDVDGVFAHNDEMMLGAITAMTAASKKPGTDIATVSVDGQKEALQAIVDGTLGATAECNPRFGPAVLDAIEAYGKGEKVTPEQVNTDAFYDASNAAAELPNAF